MRISLPAEFSAALDALLETVARRLLRGTRIRATGRLSSRSRRTGRKCGSPASPTPCTRSPWRRSWRECNSTPKQSPGPAPRRHRGHADHPGADGVDFGERVARLVDGVTKLGRIPWTADDGESAGSREKAHQAENLRKMFLAMVDDIGVVLIKLADRLHNMRTLDALPPEKQARIAQQTLEIYAPLANRLGIWQFKSELEDLAFRVINPEAYHALTREFEKRARDSAPFIEEVKAELLEALRRCRDRSGDHRPHEAHLLDLPQDAGEGPVDRRNLRRERATDSRQ